MDSERNLLLSNMRTTFIILLDYLVKYKYPKTYIIYKWTEGLIVNFKSIQLKC